jgi:hypothetical protein
MVMVMVMASRTALAMEMEQTPIRLAPGIWLLTRDRSK